MAISELLSLRAPLKTALPPLTLLALCLLHSHYRLSFEPKDPHPGLHSIRVRLRDPAQNESVLFRSSYWASELGK